MKRKQGFSDISSELSDSSPVQVKDINDRCSCSLEIRMSGRMCNVYLIISIDERQAITKRVFRGAKEIAEELVNGNLKLQQVEN